MLTSKNLVEQIFDTAKPFYHFSIDDVFDSLIEITDQKIHLLEHPYFNFLKKIHDRYGMRMGLHLFHQKKVGERIRTLEEVRDLRKDLQDAGGWIYFGPHAFNYETPPYAQTPEEQIATFDKTYKEIDRFAGRNYYARSIRLHFYSESFELADYFMAKGVRALFSTDRDAVGYRVPEGAKNDLAANGFTNVREMSFVRTQFRVEFFANDNLQKPDIERLLRKAYEAYGYIIFYVHEYELVREEVLRCLEISFESLQHLNLPSVSHP